MAAPSSTAASASVETFRSTSTTFRIPVTITYSDFEETDGIRSAMHVEMENPMSGRTVLTIEKVEKGLDLADEVFTLEDPDAEEGQEG